MPDLKQLVTPDKLRELAGDAAFERGKKYFEDEQVVSLSQTAQGFTSQVFGTEIYTVKISAREGALSYDCTCPVGASGDFCKHCVAVCLAWLERGAEKRKSRSIPAESVQSWIETQDKDVLAKLLLGLALKDKALFRQLSLKAARTASGKTVAGLHKLFEQAVSFRDFVPYEESRDYAYGILATIEEFEGAIAKDAQGVVDLCEHALRRVKHAIGHVDDSNGELSTVIERLQDIHHKACKSAKPNPKELASKLLYLELESEYGEFYDTITTYADVLGEEGGAEFVRLARGAWDRLPALAPKPRDPNMNVRVLVDLRKHAEEAQDPREAHRRPLTRIMATLARREGNFDAMVDVLSKDLSDAHAFIQLVELSREHKRYDQACDWARKGVEAFKGERLAGLDILLAEELRRAGKHDEAIAIVWEQFADRPSISAFEALETYAEPLDRDQWRDKAIGHLRKTLAKQDGWNAMETRTLLVEIYLRENNIDMALAEAGEPCRWETLTRLAKTCENSHAEEALNIYKRLVPSIIENTINKPYTPNQSYEQAVDLMLQAAKLANKLNKKAEFTTWRDTIGAKCKPKRNFMKLFDQAKWP